MTSAERRVHLAHVERGTISPELVGDAMQWAGINALINPGTTVFVKPNLTWPKYLPGVTTSFDAIKSVLKVVSDLGARVLLGEANGGYHSFLAEEAFEGHGLAELCQYFGVKLINLSKEPSRRYSHVIAGRSVDVELPRLLVEESDFLLTIPVPKVHAMTYVSLAFKNQWGCLPDHMRLRNHPEFAHKVIAINELVRTRAVVVDGSYFLDRSGPLVGRPIPLNLSVVSNDCGAASFACCQVMRLDPMKAPHHIVALEHGVFPAGEHEVVMNREPIELSTHVFRLKRSPVNWLALGAFRSQLWTRIVYDSAIAGPLHGILRGIRAVRPLRRLFYGSWETTP